MSHIQNDIWLDNLKDRAIGLGIDPFDYDNVEKLEQAVIEAAAEEFDAPDKESTADNIMDYIVNGK